MKRKNTKQTPIGSCIGDSDKFYYSRKCRGSGRNVSYTYSIPNFPDYRLSFRQQQRIKTNKQRILVSMQEITLDSKVQRIHKKRNAFVSLK